MSEPDRRLFGRPEFAGRFGADLAGAGGRGVVDDERLMPLPWGFAPEHIESPVRLWLGEHDELVPAQVWLERRGRTTRRTPGGSRGSRLLRCVGDARRQPIAGRAWHDRALEDGRDDGAGLARARPVEEV